MATFSILVRVRDATKRILEDLVAVMEAQTFADWELVLVVSPFQAQDRILVADLVARYPRVRQELRPEGELLAWSCNALLSTLGPWVGFLGQRDRLLPTALAEVQLGIASHPDAKILFTDEEARNASGLISLRFSKGGLNPFRLRTQEYLRDLTVFEKAWLEALGGFDRMASDWPAHDLFLRTLDARGAGAFVNIPQRLYQRFRNHALQSEDVRRKDHMVGYDLYGIRQHLVRQGLKAQVEAIGGTVQVHYQHVRRPSVTILALLGDDAELGCRQLRALAGQPDTAYRQQAIRPVHRGGDTTTRAIYAQLAAKLGFQPVQAWAGELPQYLNQKIPRLDSELVCLLDGLPLEPEWLHKLVDHVILPDVGAIGPRLISPARITQPGLLGYRFEGWDWNTRGRFNQLTVPHQVSAVSPHCLLLDVARFIAIGGCDTSLPTLYGMDLCLRLDATGHANIMVPTTQVQVQESVIPLAEITQFNAKWAGWEDRFGLHLPTG